MFLAKDINALIDNNYSEAGQSKNNCNQKNKEKRRPILKKNSLSKNTDQSQGQSQKQNHSDSSKHTLSEVDTSSGRNGSFQYMRQIEKKKKSIFLELDQWKKSCQRRDSKNSKKISFLSMNSYQNNTFMNQSNFKQSNVNIVFSNSNISDCFLNGNRNQIDSDFLPETEKTLKDSSQQPNQNFKSSKVVQVRLLQPPFIKIESKNAHLQNNRKSNRIIESDTNKNQNHKLPKEEIDHEKFNKNRTLYKNSESNLCKKAQSYQQCFYSDSNQGQCFTIKQTPPIEWLLNKQKSLIDKKSIASSFNQMKLGTVDQALSYRNRIENVKKILMESFKSSTEQETDNLLVTLNPVSSTVFPENDSCIQFQLEDEFKDNFFNKINSYRFLNRLSYKVSKFLDFNGNKRALEELKAQMTKVKCFNLLNAQLELQAFSKSSHENVNQFMKILQLYIEKERQQPYWSQVEAEFYKIGDSPFSLDNKILKFLSQTIPQMQKFLTIIQTQLQKDMRTKQTLLAQLRLELLKHLLYDAMKLNHEKNIRLPVTMKINESRQKRLTQIVEKDQWLEKVAFSDILPQFQKLKLDFRQLI